jgi:hypothetical protein
MAPRIRPDASGGGGRGPRRPTPSTGRPNANKSPGDIDTLRDFFEARDVKGLAQRTYQSYVARAIKIVKEGGDINDPSFTPDQKNKLKIASDYVASQLGFKGKDAYITPEALEIITGKTWKAFVEARKKVQEGVSYDDLSDAQQARWKGRASDTISQTEGNRRTTDAIRKNQEQLRGGKETNTKYGKNHDRIFNNQEEVETEAPETAAERIRIEKEKEKAKKKVREPSKDSEAFVSEAGGEGPDIMRDPIDSVFVIKGFDRGLAEDLKIADWGNTTRADIHNALAIKKEQVRRQPDDYRTKEGLTKANLLERLDQAFDYLKADVQLEGIDQAWVKNWGQFFPEQSSTMPGDPEPETDINAVMGGNRIDFNHPYLTKVDLDGSELSLRGAMEYMDDYKRNVTIPARNKRLLPVTSGHVNTKGASASDGSFEPMGKTQDEADLIDANPGTYVEVVGLPTRKNGGRVIREQQTNKYMMTVKLPGEEGTFDSRPVEGYLYDLGDRGFAFAQTSRSDPNKVLGYYRVPTQEFAKPEKINPQDFHVLLNQSKSDPYFEGNSIQEVSTPDDVRGHYDLESDRVAGKSGDLLRALGPDQKIRGKTPTLANIGEVEATPQGEAINPNKTQDFARNLLQGLRETGENGNFITRPLARGAESLIDLTVGDNIRRIAGEQVINNPSSGGAKPLPARLADSFPVNEDRLTQLAGSMAEEGYELSANDLGLLSQATQADPDLVRDLLERAMARGEKANIIGLNEMYKNTDDVAELEKYFSNMEASRIAGARPVEEVMDLFFDADGNVRTGDGLDAASIRAQDLIANGGDGNLIADGNIESLYALQLANRQPDAGFDTQIEQLTQSLGEQINLNPKKFSQASPMLSSQLRKVREVLKGDGLQFYGPIGSTGREEVKLAMKAAEARDVWAEIKIETDPARKAQLQNKLQVLSQQIQELQLPNSPTVVAGDVSARMEGGKNQQGQRVVNKTIEDTDAGFVAADDASVDPAAESLSDTSIQGGFQDFASGIRGSMSRLPEAQFKQIIGRAVAGDPQVLESMGFRTAEEFKDFFVRGYYKSGLGDGGSSNQATVFPATKANFMEYQSAAENVSRLQQEVNDLANVLSVGRNNKGLSRAEYEGRRANSERVLAEKKQELEIAQQEMNNFPEVSDLEGTRSQLLGYLDDVSQGTARGGAAQIDSSEIVQEEVDQQLKGIKNPAKARRTPKQVIQGLLGKAVPETAVPWQGEATLENFLKNYDMGAVPKTRTDKIVNLIRGNYSRGDIASPEEGSIQGARRTITPQTAELLRQVQNGLESVSPEVQQAALADLDRLQKWAEQQMLYGGVGQDPKTLASKQVRRLSDAPLGYIPQNQVPGVDISQMTPEMQEQLVWNPAYNTWATGRGETMEEVNKKLERLQPYATFNNQLFNMSKALENLRVRRDPTAIPEGDGSTVEFFDPEKQKKLPIATDLGQLIVPDTNIPGTVVDGVIMKGPNKGMRLEDIKTVDRGVSGVNNFYVTKGSPAHHGIEAILGNEAMTELSLDDGWRATQSDQTMVILNNLQEDLRRMGSDQDVVSAKVAGETDKFGNLVKSTDESQDIMAQQATLQTIKDTIQAQASSGFLSVGQVRKKASEMVLIDNAIREMDKVRNGLDNTVEQGFYKRPLWEERMVDRGGGNYAIMARTSPSGVGPKGRALEMGQQYNLQIPIGLKPEDAEGITVRDSRAASDNSHYVQYAFNEDGTITPVARDIEAENTLAANRGGRLSEADMIIGSTNASGQARPSSEMATPDAYRKGLENARRDAPATPNAESDIPPNKDAASNIRTWREYAKTRPNEFGSNVVDAVKKHPFRTAAGVTAGMFLGPAIDRAISPDQLDRERALAPPPPIDPAELQRQRDQELLERIGGRRPLKSVTTQVPMSGRGRR